MYATVTDIVIFTKCIVESLACNFQIDLVFTDFKKVFDAVNHKFPNYLIKTIIDILNTFFNWFYSLIINQFGHEL